MCWNPCKREENSNYYQLLIFQIADFASQTHHHPPTRSQIYLSSSEVPQKITSGPTMSSGCCYLRSPCVHAGFLRVHQFPSIYQNHAIRRTGSDKLPMGVKVCVWYSVRYVIHKTSLYNTLNFSDKFIALHDLLQFTTFYAKTVTHTEPAATLRGDTHAR